MIWKIYCIGLLLIGVVGEVLGAGVVRVLNWNLYNYVVTDRVVEGVFRRNYPKPEVEKAAVREVLRSHDADVLVLQEIGPVPFLLSLREDLRRLGLDYPYWAHQCGSDEVRCLAILSRVPFLGVYRHNALTVRVQGVELPTRRGLLEVVLDVDGEPWHLFNVHLKSRLTVDAQDFQARAYRTAEATAFRDLIRRRVGELEDALVLVAGDFNDHPRSSTLMRFQRVGERRLLLDVGAEDGRGDRWTYHHARSERYERIDYMLFSPRLAERIEKPGVRISDEPAQRVASDHRALVVELARGCSAR